MKFNTDVLGDYVHLGDTVFCSDGHYANLELGWVVKVLPTGFQVVTSPGSYYVIKRKDRNQVVLTFGGKKLPKSAEPVFKEALAKYKDLYASTVNRREYEDFYAQEKGLNG